MGNYGRSGRDPESYVGGQSWGTCLFAHQFPIQSLCQSIRMLSVEVGSVHFRPSPDNSSHIVYGQTCIGLTELQIYARTGGGQLKGRAIYSQASGQRLLPARPSSYYTQTSSPAALIWCAGAGEAGSGHPGHFEPHIFILPPLTILAFATGQLKYQDMLVRPPIKGARKASSMCRVSAILAAFDEAIVGLALYGAKGD